MHRVDSPGSSGGKFVAPDSGTGTPGTKLGKDWHNDIQENVARAVESAGLTLVKGTDVAPAGYDQLTQAVKRLAGGAIGAQLRNLFINGAFALWQSADESPPAWDIGDTRPDGPWNYFADQWFARLGTNGIPGRGTIARVDLGVGGGASPRSGSWAVEWVQVIGASGGLSPYVEQRLELLEELDGLTMNVSLSAKVSSGTLTMTPYCRQNFGVGGSAEVVTDGAAWTWDTTMKRWSAAIVVPSIVGKTVGPGAFTAFGWKASGGTTFTARFAAAQLEVGTEPSEFTVPDIATELLRAQRYYFKSYNPATPVKTVTGVGAVSSDEGGTAVQGLNFSLPVPMRTAPAVTWVSPTSGNTGFVNRGGADSAVSATTDTGERQSGYPTTASTASPATAHVILDARL